MLLNKLSFSTNDSGVNSSNPPHLSFRKLPHLRSHQPLSSRPSQEESSGTPSPGHSTTSSVSIMDLSTLIDNFPAPPPPSPLHNATHTTPPPRRLQHSDPRHLPPLLPPPSIPLPALPPLPPRLDNNDTTPKAKPKRPKFVPTSSFSSYTFPPSPPRAGSVKSAEFHLSQRSQLSPRTKEHDPFLAYIQSPAVPLSPTVARSPPPVIYVPPQPNLHTSSSSAPHNTKKNGGTREEYIDLGASIESLAWTAGVMKRGSDSGSGDECGGDDERSKTTFKARFQAGEQDEEEDLDKTPKRSNSLNRRRQSYKLVRKPSISLLDQDSTSSSDEESFDRLFDSRSSTTSTTPSASSSSLSPYWIHSKRFSSNPHSHSSERRQSSSTSSSLASQPDAEDADGRSKSWNGSPTPKRVGSWRHLVISAPETSRPVPSLSSSLPSPTTTPSRITRPTLKRPSTPSTPRRARTDTVVSSSSSTTASSASTIPIPFLHPRPLTPHRIPVPVRTRSTPSPSNVNIPPLPPRSSLPSPPPSVSRPSISALGPSPGSRISRLPTTSLNPLTVSSAIPSPTNSRIPHSSAPIPSSTGPPQRKALYKPPSLSTLQYTGTKPSTNTTGGGKRLTLVDRKSFANDGASRIGKAW